MSKRAEVAHLRIDKKGKPHVASRHIEPTPLKNLSWYTKNIFHGGKPGRQENAQYKVTFATTLFEQGKFTYPAQLMDQLPSDGQTRRERRLPLEVTADELADFFDTKRLTLFIVKQGNDVHKEIAATNRASGESALMAFATAKKDQRKGHENKVILTYPHTDGTATRFSMDRDQFDKAFDDYIHEQGVYEDRQYAHSRYGKVRLAQKFEQLALHLVKRQPLEDRYLLPELVNKVQPTTAEIVQYALHYVDGHNPKEHISPRLFAELLRSIPADNRIYYVDNIAEPHQQRKDFIFVKGHSSDSDQTGYTPLRIITLAKTLLVATVSPTGVYIPYIHSDGTKDAYLASVEQYAHLVDTIADPDVVRTFQQKLPDTGDYAIKHIQASQAPDNESAFQVVNDSQV